MRSAIRAASVTLRVVAVTVGTLTTMVDARAQQRSVPRPSVAALPRAAAKPVAAPVDPGLLKGLSYRMIGPARGGRVTTVTGVASQPLVFYMGSTGGGVWKTTDAGQTWSNTSDRYFAVGSMGDIAVSESDPSVVYAGTGSDGLRSNVSIGNGVYRSADAGSTWMHVGLEDVGNIGGVIVHPSDPNTALVAAIGNPFKPNADRGVFRTNDGGTHWKKVLFVNDSTGVVDVEFLPGNPNVVFASVWRAERKPWTIISGSSEGGIYKSTDGGTSWKKLTGGLPNQLFGKSNIAVTAGAPNRVYALIEAKPGSGLYRSDDAGENWVRVSDFAQLYTRPFYYTNVSADPKNPDRVWVGSEGSWMSMDAGRSWKQFPVPHGDNHDLWINPNNTDLMIEGNDGGATVSLNGGKTWSTLYNQPTAEIYQVIGDNQFPYRVYGAQQDNSTLIVPSLPLTSGRPDDPMQEWKSGPGCETGPIMPHPINADTVYGACKGQFSRMSMRTGQEKNYWVGAQSLYGNPGKDLIYRFQRVSPMEISPHDPRIVYYGSQYVHRTRDEGVTWETISPDLTWFPPNRQQNSSGEPITIDVTGEEYYSVTYAIRESLKEPGVIWVGANDGPFHVTRDQGKSWATITPPDQPQGCRVQNIEPSPHRAASAYYAVLCYQLGDFHPYIWRTDDYGQHWVLLTPGDNGLPADQPTRVVREDPDREGLLYAGTEFGMFISFDNGAHWQDFQLNLPHVPVTDVRVHRKDLLISTQGRAFWILDNLTALHQAGDVVAHGPAHLFKPREAVRFRYAGFGGVESSRNNPGDPQYPPVGAAIDYWLSDDGARTLGAVTLDILDSEGTPVRSFSSAADGESMQEPEAPGMRAPEMLRVGTPALPRAAGTNRFYWDLTTAGPWVSAARQSGRNGPTIVPGNYIVRLTVAGESAEVPLVVRPEPRATKDGVSLAVLQEQYTHNVRARDLVSEVNQLVARVDDARKRLASATGVAGDTLVKLNDLRAKLVTPDVRYSKPELQAHIQYLYSMTIDAAQKIGRDAVARFGQLRTELDARQREAKALLPANRIM